MRRVVALVLAVATGFIGGFIWSSYTVAPDQTEAVRTTNDPRSPRGSALLYGRIEGVNIALDETELDVMLVEWVRGADNQEQAALEADRCTLERIENDECVPNGFFVRETSKRMALPIASDAEIAVYARVPGGGMRGNAKGNIYMQKITPAALAALMAQEPALKDVPFAFTTTHGIVTGLTEQYVP